MRGHHHGHVPAILLRLGLDIAEVRDIRRQPLQQSDTELGSGLLPPAEHDRNLDLVASLEEPHHVTLLGLVVMRIDLRSELHFLDDRLDLVLPSLTTLLVGLVLELSIVHELAYRRTRCRSDLDQIEIGFLRKPHRLGDGDDADLLAFGPNQAHLGHPDPVIDTGLCADVVPSVARRAGMTCRCGALRPVNPDARPTCRTERLGRPATRPPR